MPESRNAITEAVPPHEEFSTATAYLRVAFEASFDCLFIKDRHLKYVLVNPAMAHLFGKPVERFRGQTDALLYGKEETEVTKRLEARVLCGETVHAELDTVVEDRHLTLLIRELPLRDRDGTIVGLCGIARDISHRRKTAKDDKETQERLRMIFEDAPDAHFLSDTRGTFLDGNKAAERLCGYSRGELVGRNPVKLRLLRPQDIRRAIRLLLRTASGQPTGPEEFTLNRAGGGQVVVEIRTFPVKMGNRNVVLGIARDITDLRRAEAERNRFVAAIEEIAESVVIADPDGTIEYVNSAFTAMTGFGREDALGQCISFPADNEADSPCVQELRQAVRQKKRWTSRLETDRKDGTRLIEEMTLLPVQNEAGMLTGFVAIRRSISDRETSKR